MILLLSVTVVFGWMFNAVAEDSLSDKESRLTLDSGQDRVWDSDIGHGFRKHAFHLGLNAGGGFGLKIFGGRSDHDIALGDVDFGAMLSGPVGREHFYRGNFEFIGEVFGGEQFNHHTAYVVGFAPLIRYDFATGSRLVPFFGGGVGPTLTDIRHPDLSTDFEFNVQVGAGVHWFFQPKLAATLEARWLHLSNGGFDHPNQGANTSMILVGANWFF